MKKSDLRKIITEELLKEANETPTSAFVKDAKSIDGDLATLNKWWATSKERLKKQIKKNPQGWAYLGDGAELRDFANHLKEMVSDYRQWKLGE